MLIEQTNVGIIDKIHFENFGGILLLICQNKLNIGVPQSNMQKISIYKPL